jgi:hypothetical protein
MHDEFADMMRRNYNASRASIVTNPLPLIELEQKLMNLIAEIITNNWAEFERDFNEASRNFPLWANHIPRDRGRAPRGDQIPWIEVGEHSIGHKLSRMLSGIAEVREIGLPFGSDDRFVITNDEVSAFLFFDLKSVLHGGRDDADYIVVPPQQVSGNGRWDTTPSVVNDSVTAVGQHAQHPFHPSLPPIVATSDGHTYPSVHIFIKPVYRIQSRTTDEQRWTGQPLDRIKLICVPNGLLLTENPAYLSLHRGLFYPGKDDKSKPAESLRCRVNTRILREIDSWRVKVLTGSSIGD